MLPTNTKLNLLTQKGLKIIQIVDLFIFQRDLSNVVGDSVHMNYFIDIIASDKCKTCHVLRNTATALTITMPAIPDSYVAATF